MTPPKTPPTLEGFYNVKQATVKLGLATEDEQDMRGQRWLRDGVNNKGWPHHRMSKQLLFSDSDLAEIARLSRIPATKPGPKRTSTRKRTSPRPAKTADSKRPAA